MRKMAYTSSGGQVGHQADMKPVEHMWHILDLAIQKRAPKAANKKRLQCIQQEWRKIAMTKVLELVNSMPTSRAPCTSSKETNKALKCYYCKINFYKH